MCQDQRVGTRDKMDCVEGLYCRNKQLNFKPINKLKDNYCSPRYVQHFFPVLVANGPYRRSGSHLNSIVSKSY